MTKSAWDKVTANGLFARPERKNWAWDKDAERRQTKINNEAERERRLAQEMKEKALQDHVFSDLIESL